MEQEPINLNLICPAFSPARKSSASSPVPHLCWLGLGYVEDKMLNGAVKYKAWKHWKPLELRGARLSIQQHLKDIVAEMDILTHNIFVTGQFRENGYKKILEAEGLLKKASLDPLQANAFNLQAHLSARK